MKKCFYLAAWIALYAMTVSSEAVVIQGETSPGVYTNIAADSSGTLTIGTSALPTGAATAAKQDTGNTAISAMSAKLPAALGAQTGANSLSVVPNTNTAFPVTGTITAVTTITNPVTITSSTVALTDRSGTITLGGTAQTIMALNAARKYLLIQNNSDTTMWCNFGVVAVASQPSIQIVSGASLTMESSIVSGEAVSCIGATTGKTFTAKEY